MKAIGDLYTLRGQIDEDEGAVKIHLFDGNFDTAYRIIRFEVAPATLDDSSAVGVSGKVLTEDNGIAATSWDWADNREIAWAEYTHMWNVAGDYTSGRTGTIDPDNLVVEDLFIRVNHQTEGNVNYLIQMQKYDITDWQGALAMVRNKSQA